MFTLLFMCEIFIIIHILNFYLKYFPSRGNKQGRKKHLKKNQEASHTWLLYLLETTVSYCWRLVNCSIKQTLTK